MAELLAAQRGVDTPEFAFTAALLSALDLLLGVGLDELGETTDVDDSLKAAAFRREGPVGRLVAEVIDYQLGLDVSSSTGQSVEELDVAAAEAFGWAMPYVADLDG
jgi:EAL and modified HD-GYP domain-containing signal transduction protein